MKLTDEDRIELVEMYERAQNTPVIQIAPGTKDLATSAWEEVRSFMLKLGTKYGFNADNIKGIDNKTGEVMLNE